MSDNWELFRGAALVLVGPGTAKQRLIDAYRGHLASVDACALPEPACGGFAALAAAVNTCRGTGGCSAAESSIRKMSEQEAAAHARSVIELFATLTELQPFQPQEAHFPHLRVVGDVEDVPAFLSRA